ncbi:SGNH/GDSL hydrolase family protein [Pseudonocardia sp. RS010]|uniref:SGNH/GDSL hydrolase family protein n=1 Tax=Pseudonocardia sp. RS010 TaxID=3385979 RepID=UPI0039A070E8
MRRVPTVRRSLLVVLAVVAALPGTAGTALADGTEQAGRYVALGDSYSAGPLIPPSGGQPAGCLRSGANFPSLVAAVSGATDFVDVSCSGATTADFVAPQKVVLGENPAQFDALTGGEDLVTFTIGGNDIGFGEIIQECALRSPQQPLGTACRDFYGDQLDRRIAQTAPKIASVLGEIGARSPGARVAVVGYPALLPDEGPGCFPVVPLSPGDIGWLRGIEKDLNAMLAAQAGAAGAVYVDTYTPTIGHDMCQLPAVKWIEGLLPTSPAAPVHPNAQGMQAMGEAVLAALDTPVPSAA